MQPPPSKTVERWLWDYVTTTDLRHKLEPPAIPKDWEATPPVRRLEAPGRPPELQVIDKSRKFPGPGALRHALGRARIAHTFVHHELQAAELMAWAILAFPSTPSAFRRGLLAICREELRHMNLYLEILRSCDARFGDFPVRDWFWKRVPRAESPAHFLAVMGMGLEAGNLDHAERFARWFRQAGAEEAARAVETVGAEEVRHVRFAVRWFRRFTGGVDFETWRAHLPEPLSPTLMRGEELNRADRTRAGLTPPFLERLAEW
jgi:uncharacterized ferritin-like protein (DUF455 family)